MKVHTTLEARLPKDPAAEFWLTPQLHFHFEQHLW